MLDINFSDFHIPMWVIYTAIIGFFFCLPFFIAGLTFLANKEYKNSTFIFSTIVTGLVLLCYYFTAVYPENFAFQFIPVLTCSFDIIVFLVFNDYLPIYGFYILSAMLKFLIVFGFVGVIQKILQKYFYN
jgi:hypothetical protein